MRNIGSEDEKKGSENEKKGYYLGSENEIYMHLYILGYPFGNFLNLSDFRYSW